VTPGSAPSPHQGPLSGLGLASDAEARLCSYLDLLAAWAGRVNLTGAGDAVERVALLVESVAPAAQLPAAGSHLLDIGSGNGSPGLVLALLRPDLCVSLLEPRLKRWAFLREACRSVGRPDIQVRRERHDEYPGPAAEVVTLRGLALPLRAVLSLVAVGGRVIVFGEAGKPPLAEPPFVLEERLSLPRGEARVFRECST
jgi:16S rRNA (guanine527-N7)-methyltransferase